MIECGATPRPRGWRGLWAVLGLGVLLLPAGAWAQPPAQADPDKKSDEGGIRFSVPVQIVTADAPTNDLDKAKAELKQLEAMLAQKQGEVAEIAARIQALRAKAAQSGAPDGRRIAVWQAVPDGGNPVVFKDALQRLATAQPGGTAVKVIVVDGATGKVIMERNEPAAVPAPPAPGAPVTIANPGYIVRLAPSEADRRIDDLESKLKAILEEVEQLRRERKPGAPQSRQDAEGSRFRIVFDKPSEPEKEPQPKEPAAERSQLRLLLQGLRQEAEKQAAGAEAQAREAEIQARLKAAETERQAAEAKVKQLEEELRKAKEAPGGDGSKKP